MTFTSHLYAYLVVREKVAVYAAVFPLLHVLLPHLLDMDEQ